MPRTIPPRVDTGMSHYTTIETARLLGLAVRSVQLMVDRGDLQAWKTPGGHRRISVGSVQRWMNVQWESRAESVVEPTRKPRSEPVRARQTGHKVLLIEDSTHFQNLISLLLRQQFPEVELRVADDGIAGLALVGEWRPDVLIVDILLPGIDGATLITSLRTHPQFKSSQLLVVTSLDAVQREPYAFALTGVPVVHKPKLVAELPALLSAALVAAQA